MMEEMKIGETMAFKCVEAKDGYERCDGCIFLQILMQNIALQMSL